MRGRLGNSAGDDYGVGLEDDAVVDDFVNREGGEVIVLDECALIDGVSVEVLRLVGDLVDTCALPGKFSLEEDVQAVAERQHHTVQHDLVLIRGSDDVEHDVALGLVDNDPVVVEDHIVC